MTDPAEQTAPETPASQPAAAPAGSRRRRVWKLLAASLVLLFAWGVAARGVHRNREYTRLRTAIEDSGGRIMAPGAQLSWPQRVVNWLGGLSAVGTNVTHYVVLHGNGINDRWFAEQSPRLAQLPEFSLSLSGCPLSEKSFERIGSLQNIRVLSLHDIPIGEAEMRHLTRLKQLRTLILYHAGQDFEALKQLTQFPALTQLHLEGAQFNSVGPEVINSIPQLTHLMLAEPTVAHLKHLAGLRPSIQVSITSLQIGPESVAELSEIKTELKQFEIAPAIWGVELDDETRQSLEDLGFTLPAPTGGAYQ